MREGRRREEWTIRKIFIIIIIIKEWGICRNPDMKKTKKKNVGRKWEGTRRTYGECDVLPVIW